MEFTIKTNKKEYAEFNGKRCRIINAHRADKYIEVLVLECNYLILLRIDELED